MIQNIFLESENNENEKLRRMHNLLIAETPEYISDNELIELERFVQGKYYTAKSFFDTISKIRSVKSMMSILYPEN